MIQLQHLGEKRLGGLGEGQKRQKGKEREKKRGRLVHLCSLSVPKPFDPLCLPLIPPLHQFPPFLHGDAEGGV